MTPSQRSRFRKLCEEFSGIITPAPGRYNQHSGHIDNSINFVEKPAPNLKVYQPKYSEEMKRDLASKMDQLLNWGVLTFPEKLGISVEYLSPCMLVPKQEPGQTRLVTDFSGVNVFIKKPPTASPSIQDAKEAITKKRYFAHIDLSN